MCASSVVAAIVDSPSEVVMKDSTSVLLPSSHNRHSSNSLKRPSRKNMSTKGFAFSVKHARWPKTLLQIGVRIARSSLLQFLYATVAFTVGRSVSVIQSRVFSNLVAAFQ